MTTPTREQIVQFDSEDVVRFIRAQNDQIICFKADIEAMTNEANIARADLQHECSVKDQTILSLEATITEQDAEMEKLKDQLSYIGTWLETMGYSSIVKGIQQMKLGG